MNKPLSQILLENAIERKIASLKAEIEMECKHMKINHHYGTDSHHQMATDSNFPNQSSNIAEQLDRKSVV